MEFNGDLFFAYGAHTVTADMVRLVSKKWWEK